MATPRTRTAQARTSDEERDFLAGYDPAAFARPSVTVDVVLLTLERGQLHTLLIRRPDHPGKGRWALPGGFIHMDESLDDAAARVLRAKTGLENVFLEQLYTFGEVDRDPRTRIISVAYYALVDAGRFAEVTVPREEAAVARLVATRSPQAVAVRSPDGGPLALAFDHESILATAFARIRGKIDYAPIGYELLPPAFTLSQLQKVHEAVLGRKLNKDSFRRRILASGQLQPTGESQQDVEHRPASLYRFTNR